jgi:hypothetical protein
MSKQMKKPNWPLREIPATWHFSPLLYEKAGYG